MLTITKRFYQDESDLAKIVELINDCEAVDCLDEGTSISELRRMLQNPILDLSRDICLWEDSDGKLVAFADVWLKKTAEFLESSFGFSIHPTARNCNLEKEIVAWAQRRSREVASKDKLSVKLRTSARAKDKSRVSFLDSCGFQVERYFYRMQRSLLEPIPEPQFPSGYIVRHPNHHQEMVAWIEMFNNSFIDHWNYQPLTIEEFEYEISDPDYRNDLDFVAIAPDGTFVAFSYCSINSAENQRKNRREGWIQCLGTIRGFRKQGLATAMLLTGMRSLQAAGMDTALLVVDTENPSGALCLYESVGFAPVYKRIFYVQEVYSSEQ
ncbi:MAG: GNAT family N-acetyltransferase [Oscillatoria sp. PMC 1051.18]|nr:GNAT family N-acetyltransferase [Oscillatoria sp. PMC 1050.18]MEC5030627.1 GNAT family N-acetyltransferase [Oscillatoria sp. PMC 1051.18]